MSADIPDAYLDLLRFGDCTSRILCDNGAQSDEADAWFARMETLAAEDGLLTEQFWDVVGAGSFAIPGLRLLRPDGTE